MFYYEPRLKIILKKLKNCCQRGNIQRKMHCSTFLSWAEDFILKMHLGKKIHNIIDHYYDGKVGKW